MTNKVGWHYTSLQNWNEIQRDGLLPYPVDKPEFRRLWHFVPNGIWVWEYPLSPESELGTVIYQLSYRAQTQIVKLEVTYDTEDILYYEGNGYRQKVKLTHTGNAEKWQFHTDDPEAVIVTKKIPISDISLVKIFDLMDVVR